ncbi:MAG: Eco57I restriction-modification methylase domain-containing protein, partial [Prevotellaceae bacterium]|nr:Eco57I restriction-modification methylase domain-containing protein [Prevotellaceae bacterium]
MATFNFSNQYSRNNFTQFIQEFLPDDFTPNDTVITGLPLNPNNYIQTATKLGDCKSLELEVFEIQHTSTHDARVGLSREAFQMLLRHSSCNRALVVFVPQDSSQYRFSLLQMEAEQKDNSARITRSYSNPRRYSFLLGEGEKVRTPQMFLIDEGKVKARKRNGKDFTAWDDLCFRFSVEILTKEFYKELFDWYQWALSDEMAVTYPNDTSIETDDRIIQEHLIRLITRLMFVWFIKQKKLIPEQIFDENELKDILQDFDTTSTKSSNYYNAILQNLFFATLNRPINERGFASDASKSYQGKNEQYGIKTLFRDANEGSWFRKSHEDIIQIFRKVPFLNGGLFECLDKEQDNNGKIFYYDGFSRVAGRQKRAFIPNCLFFDAEKGLISILKRYNFTIEENTPTDVEVALDPELLGKVFENLLGAYNPETKETARKQSGSFYTPREIVNYMVDESIRAYLQQTVGDDAADIVHVETLHATSLPDPTKQKIYNALLQIKILDPACGSGAFPMGILNRIITIMQHLPLPSTISIYDLKLHLIENCIFGVDIQPIAVQISKLRFFISLVCEQVANNSNDNFGIKPLPNLETKFVTANTLIGLKLKDVQGNLFEDPQIEVAKKDLLQVRHEHFLANTPKQKKECRAKDEELRKKLAKLLEKNKDCTHEEAEQLSAWNPYDQNLSSPFFDAEWMFGLTQENAQLNTTNGYFDIVIGNPPYVEAKKLKEISSKLNNYDVYSG